jgi:DNA-binding transcriptional ArsR family regulator
MDVARPYAAICPTLDTTVLNALAGTTRPLTGREVARLTGRSSHSGVLDALNRLTEHGLVDRAEAGRALLYSLNREHLAAPAVDVLAGMRAELLERLRHAIGEWDVAPIHVSLFGSVARGDGDTRSDVDLFVVRPDGIAAEDPAWQAQRDDLAVRIQRWTGNRASIAEVAKAELARLRSRTPPVVQELLADAIVLHGRPIAELLGST